mgnify:CR=1 FL=1
MNRRILLLSSEHTGHGHKSIAQSLTSYLNELDGTVDLFAYPPVASPATPLSPGLSTRSTIVDCVAGGDVDGDKVPDLIVTNFQLPASEVIRNALIVLLPPVVRRDARSRGSPRASGPDPGRNPGAARPVAVALGMKSSG